MGYGSEIDKAERTVRDLESWLARQRALPPAEAGQARSLLHDLKRTLADIESAAKRAERRAGQG
jgi:hypothetical protein